MDGHLAVLVSTIFACTGFWELVRYLIATRRTKRTASDDADLAVIHELIYPKLEDCILRGNVGIEEFDRIDKLYKPYKELGGNGTVERRYLMVEKLPRFDDRRVIGDE